MTAVIASSCSGGEGDDGKTETLYVYNWGEYISDGSEGTLISNLEFEKYCKEVLKRNVKGNYSTFSSNESLYAKLSGGTVSYDVIVPSDYMVERLISEGLLMEIDPEKNIENYKYIDEKFKGLYYDKDQLYSVPYTYGTVGVIYNTDIVDKDDESIGSWDLMWDEDYKGNILQFNNPRDAFATAMFRLGYSINSNDPEQWREALSLLMEQKNVVQGYVMDEIFNKLKGGSAAVASYYAGDFFTMYVDNDRLSFYTPKEGANVFVDAMCIPKNSKNYDLALEYINFMLSREVAIANAEYICYASPNKLVYEDPEYISYMTEEIHPDAMDILYNIDLDKMEYFYDLSSITYTENGVDKTVLSLMNSLWEELKIESNIGTSVYVICGVIVFTAVSFGMVMYIRKKKRQSYYD